MAPFEMQAFGTGQPVEFIYEDSHALIFNSVPTTVPTDVTDSGSHDFLNNATALNSALFLCERHESYSSSFWEETLENLLSFLDHRPPEGTLDTIDTMYSGSDGGRTSDGVLGELPHENWPWMETEQENSCLPLPSASPCDSVQDSDSTLTSGPTMTTSPEQGGSVEDPTNLLEGVTSWPAPALFPAIEDNSFMSAASPCQTQQSTFEEVSKKERTGKRRRSAESNKHSCEIRISKKIPRDGRYLKEKAWLGTFATLAERGRALDVGKYFLSAKKNKTFSDPNSKAVLAAFEDHLQALPLSELVEAVTKLAKHYGENDSLPQSLDSL
jgi:hypothetical protein